MSDWFEIYEKFHKAHHAVKEIENEWFDCHLPDYGYNALYCTKNGLAKQLERLYAERGPYQETVNLCYAIHDSRYGFWIRTKIVDLDWDEVIRPTPPMSLEEEIQILQSILKSRKELEKLFQKNESNPE